MATFKDDVQVFVGGCNSERRLSTFCKGTLRNNEAAVLISCIFMQDLLRIFESLVSQPKQARKLIERIARLQRLGPAETKAVLDLCSWQEDHFRELINVLEKFECYETADVK